MFRANRLYFYLCIGFAILAAIPLFFINKGDAILFFNDYRSPLTDTFFKYFTKVGEEPLYLAAVVCLLFLRIQNAILVPLLGVIVTLMSFLLKNFFATPRPIAFFRSEGLANTLQLIEGVDLHSGANSFPSGHTMSGFALYTFIALLVMNKNWAAILLFIMAFLVGVSRVYLVQHFWQDIYAGALVGVGIGILFYQLHLFLYKNKNAWWNRSILNKPMKPQV